MRKQDFKSQREKVSERVWSLFINIPPPRRLQVRLITQETTFEGLVDYFFKKYNYYLRKFQRCHPLDAHKMAMNKIDQFFEAKRLSSKVLYRRKKDLKSVKRETGQ